MTQHQPNAEPITLLAPVEEVPALVVYDGDLISVESFVDLCYWDKFEDAEEEGLLC